MADEMIMFFFHIRINIGSKDDDYYSSTVYHRIIKLN